MRTSLTTLLLLAACEPKQGPKLLVLPAADQDTLAGVLEARVSDGDWDESATCDAVFEAGDAMQIAWVLPPTVRDPSEDASVLVQSACGTTAMSAGFSGGLSLTLLSAPDGASAGLLISVSAQGSEATCQTAALEVAGVETLCPEADSGGQDTDTGG